MAFFKFSRSFTRTCPESWINNSICNLECMSEVNSFDGGDCDWLCSLTGCNRNASDNTCDPQCNTTVCAFDFGDCGYCRPGCSKSDFFDKKCNQNCDFEECDYDNFECGTCAKGCTTALNYNSICNKECNRKECNWDNRRCSTSCSTYCINSKVGDGKCDLSCNTTECSFDGGDCYCSPGCPPTKFGNGMCDTYCNTSSCFYDYGECFCAPGCSPALLLNKKCDPVCNVTSCYFDMNDCICPENCTDTLRLDNNTCDPFCNISACAWDDGRCHCTPGCFPENISNGVCNEACFNSGCFYDGGDCDCSLGCSPEMQLNDNCEAACNNTNCKFDNEKCFCNPGCNFSMINDKHCDPECNNSQCWYDGGDCNCMPGCFPDMIGNKKCESVCNRRECDYDSIDCECYPGCTHALYNEPTCNQACNFKSCGFHKNLCGDCASNCFDENLTNNVCDIDCRKSVDCDFDYKDCSDIYYYWPHKCIFARETLENIQTTSCHRYFEFAKGSLNAHIFILGGNFTFTNTMSNLLTEMSTLILVIEPLYCSSISTEGCYEDGVRALFNLSLPMQILVKGSVKLISIEFTSFHPNSSFYSYCPFIKKVGYLHFDDRGDQVKNFDSSLCNLSATISFIHVLNDSKLTLSNILFKDMRFEYKSILNIESGEVVLQEVSFFNIVTRNTSSVVQIDPTTCASELFKVKFHYSGGSITFINNGFEVISEYPLAGFLSLCNIEDLILENLQFSMNVFSQSNLVKIVDFYRFKLENITVEFSYSNSDLLTLKLTKNSDFFEKSHTFLNSQHIWIKGLTVKTNIAKSVVILFLESECRNVKIEDCNFESNEVELSVFHYKISKSDSTCIAGGKLVDLKGIEQQVHAREFLFINSKFFLSLAQVMVSLEIKGKIIMQSLHFEKNMNFSLLVGSSIASKIQHSGGYMKKSGFNVTSTCESLLSVDSAFSPVLENSSFIDNFCVLAEFVNTSKSFLLNSTDFFNNEAILHYHLIYLQVFKEGIENITNGDFVFSHLEFANNLISEDSGGILKFSKLSGGKIKLIEVNFESSGCAIYSEEVKFLELRSVSVKSGTSSSVSVLRYFPAGDSILDLLSVTVESCKSSLIRINGNYLTKMTLTISKSSFISNNALDLILIDNRINLSSSVVIESDFKGNSGLLFKTSSSGFLSFRNNKFLYNFNEMCCIFEAKGSMELFWSSNSFTSNNGSSLISIVSMDNSSVIESYSNTFEENKGSAFAISFALLKDSKSIYINNSHSSGTVLLSTSSSVSILKSLTITENSASSNGNIVNSIDSSVFLFSSIIKGNSAKGKGGVLYNDQKSFFLVSESEFEGNSAEEGACIYSHNSNKENLIKSSTFKFNSATVSSSVSLLESDLKIVSSLFYSNSGKIYAGVSSTFDSSLTIENSLFNNSQGASLHSESSKMVKVLNSNFSSSSTEGLSFFGIFASRFECHSCHISQGKSQGSSSVYCRESTCSFFSSTFEGINNSLNGAVVQAQGSQVLLNRCRMAGLVGSGVFLETGSELEMNFSEIYSKKYLDSSASNGAGVNCLNCKKVNLVFSSFLMLESSEKGGGCFFATSADPPEVVITNSNFSKCSAQTGGGLFLLNSNASIFGSFFSENTARPGSLEKAGHGGAVFIESPSFSIPVEINASSFVLNSASTSGGALQWYDVSPSVAGAIFKKNSAFYGPDIGSFPDHLSFESTRKLEEFEAAPGQKMVSPILIYSVDHYEQVVLTDNISSVYLSVKDPLSFSLVSPSKQTSQEGLYKFSEVLIKGMPLSRVALVVTSDFSEVGNEESDRLEFEVKLRDCFAGESLNDQKCSLCVNNTYNLKPRQTCKKCPEGAICNNGNQILSKPGYWRSKNDSDVFYQCPNEDACLLEVQGKFDEKCKEGYTDKLCQSCASGYFRSFLNVCSRCLEHSKNTALLAGLLFATTLFLAGITVSNIKGAYEDESITSIYYKILMNYLQIVSFATSLNMAWPSYVKKMFEMQGKFSVGFDQVLSIDCFLQSKTQPIFAKVVILSLVPIFCFCFSALSWAIWRRLRKSHNFKEKLIGSVIVQLFFFQPNQADMAFSMLNCSEFTPGNYYLTEEMSVRCWSGQHLKVTLAFALPSLIIWCIGVPTFLVVILAKNRSKLDEITEKLKYGFLYKGFKTSHFYWEFIIMLKKFLIISACVFLRTVSVLAQALVIFIIILISYALQLKLQPYTMKRLNVMELRAILVSVVSIYCGIFFLTDELPYEGKLIIFVMMILSNLAFLLYWVYFTFGYYIGAAYIKSICCKKLFKGKLDTWATKIVPITSADQDVKDDSKVERDIVFSL